MAPIPSRKPIRTVIVDDEDLARDVLREYLREFPEIEILSECRNGFEAVKAIADLSPDLVFLDIQMPKLNGFEVLELLDETPAIVFATAYDEYALRAFEIHAIDYLLKPFSPERLAEALEQVKRDLGSRKTYPAAGLVKSAHPPGKRLERVLVKDGSRVTVIAVDEIDYLEAQDDYIGIHSGAKCHLKQQTLTELNSLLDPDQFVLIHRSYVLNINRLTRIELYAKDSRIAVIEGGKQLPISRSGYSRLKELL